MIGASMGCMIAQTAAARHPDRVLSAGLDDVQQRRRWSGPPPLSLYACCQAAGAGREAYMNHPSGCSRASLARLRARRRDLRRIAGMSYDRGTNPAGPLRQLAAIIASGDRRPLLRTITAHTLVIHGEKDRLVPPPEAAPPRRAIPAPATVMIEGLGTTSPAARGRGCSTIAQNAARAGARPPCSELAYPPELPSARTG